MQLCIYYVKQYKGMNDIFMDTMYFMTNVFKNVHIHYTVCSCGLMFKIAV